MLERLTDGPPPPPIKTHEEPADSIFSRQRGLFLPQAESAVSKLGVETQQLFSAVLFDTQEFAEHIKRLTRLLEQRPESWVESFNKKNSRNLAGFLFEIIAFNFLKGKIGPGEVLLSPTETFDFYKQLHPKKPIVFSNAFGFGLHSGILGITVPDGILLTGTEDKTKIIGVCEYTLIRINAHWLNKQKQKEHYQNIRGVVKDLSPSNLPFPWQFLGQNIHQRYPHLPATLSIDEANFRIIYVLPQGKNEVPHLLNEEIVTIPLSRKEFGGVAQEIFQDIKNACLRRAA